jgi:hypothetical protein
MEKKGKPENLKPFKPGQSGNPGGKTSAQRKLEIENLELAQRAKNRFLRALVAKQEEQSTDDVLDGLSGSDILRLIKDAEDRVMGTPRQSVDHTSTDGSMTPKGIPDELTAALDAIAGKVAGGDGKGKVAGDS